MVAPEMVYVAPEVQPDRIAPGVILHPGCRLYGAQTVIGPSSELGGEQPVTVVDCQLGTAVRLQGGYFTGSVFLDGVQFGSAGHVRAGCLLEEAASAGHAVGLKQTILMPWVTLGSLINLCDCLVAGGTGRHDHGEVGSSYIHFNFSSHGDKATPSLVGDVPRGVMLDQPPVFLGGQGGLVGPRRLAFGTVVAAGTVLRHDVLEAGCLVKPVEVAPDATPPGARLEPYDRTRYRDPLRRVRANLLYLGNLWALVAWYREARASRLAGPWAEACHAGALAVLTGALEERRRRLTELFERLPDSLAAWRSEGGVRAEAVAAEHQALINAWPRLREQLATEPSPAVRARDRDAFLAALQSMPPGLAWPAAIQGLEREARLAGSGWLDGIVASTSDLLGPLAASCTEQE